MSSSLEWGESSSRPAAPAPNKTSNLVRFLQCVTPAPLSTVVGDLNSRYQTIGSKDGVVQFTLADLWDCYDEFSAYGAGIAVTLNDDEFDSITQYYVPYLSAIQLYTNKSSSASSSKASGGKDSGSVEVENDSTDGDSGSNSSGKTWDGVCDDYSNSSSEIVGSSSLPKKDEFGSLYFHFVEVCSPYVRVPLREKVAELAAKNPGLMTLKNVDLSPASWMAVAWYPIYHIPSRRDEKDLQAGFLTFHTLSSSFQDCETANENKADCETANENKVGSLDVFRTGAGSDGEEDGGRDGIPLPPFGLATYKMRGDVWVTYDTDYETVDRLQSAADSWLKQLNVYHHDFNFFKHSAK